MRFHHAFQGHLSTFKCWLLGQEKGQFLFPRNEPAFCRSAQSEARGGHLHLYLCMVQNSRAGAMVRRSQCTCRKGIRRSSLRQLGTVGGARGSSNLTSMDSWLSPSTGQLCSSLTHICARRWSRIFHQQMQHRSAPSICAILNRC